MSESGYRRILRERMQQAGSATAGQADDLAKDLRVQKNLSLRKSDAERMAALARRDQRSQARLIAAALDCYEDAFGRLSDRGEAP